MNCRNLSLLSLALLTAVCQSSYKAIAQSAPTQSVPIQPAPTQSVPIQPTPTQSAPTQPDPTQPTPTQSAPTQPTSTQSTPNWFKQIGKSYQGEFWKNGKIVGGSTLFYFSAQTGLSGMYIANQDGNLLTGDLTECQAKQDRTIRCQWREPNQTGEFEATFSSDFLSFKGVETMKGDSTQHPWQGSREQSSAAVVP